MTKKRGAAGAGVELSRVRVEALAMFRHDGLYRRPGDVVETTEADAADLIALGFARLAPELPARRAGA
jgi:hypothetical protein